MFILYHLLGQLKRRKKSVHELRESGKMKWIGLISICLNKLFCHAILRLKSVPRRAVRGKRSDPMESMAGETYRWQFIPSTLIDHRSTNGRQMESDPITSRENRNLCLFLDRWRHRAFIKQNERTSFVSISISAMLLSNTWRKRICPFR